ncbi:MAG: hypothetical protein MUE56_06365, partial [Ignavibacteria bacterium]|nr:hypothetical protein [Ignavibacteria bacterium]
PRAPSIIVESGRGAHLYWLLKQVNEVNDPERVEKVLKNISQHIGCDTDINLDTVLRLPETVNTKITGKPVNCDVKFINPNFRYTIQDFENLGQRIVPPAPTRVTAPVSAPAAQPTSSFTDDPTENRYPAHGTSQTLDDSLVLDETIIDELIDDISMAGSVVADATAPTELPYGLEDADSIVTNLGPSSTLHVPTSSVAVGTTSSVLQRMSTARAEVQIRLVGSDTKIDGILIWNENGLVGVEAGDEVYTIPLSSISFIKSKSYI